MLRLKLARILHATISVYARIVNSICLGLLDDKARMSWSDFWYSKNKWRYLPHDVVESDIIKVCKEYNFQTVLDIGAGFGREAKLFALQGLKVIALEKDSEMIAYANRLLCHHDDIHWLNQDLLSYKFDQLKVDLVYISSLIYTHFAKTQRVELLHKLQGALNQDGILVLSYRSRSARGAQSLYYTLLYWIGCFTSWLTLKSVNFSIGDRLNNRFIAHSFTQSEIEDELRQAGYNVLKYHRVQELIVDLVYARRSP